jgi:phosphoglycerol transferase MdoB-like AlkP superfamily enzyme
MQDPHPPANGDDQREGPTELVETDDGQLVERLSGGTATLLLVWLIGVGALSTLFAGWLFVLVVYDVRLGPSALIGGFGFYVGLAGASGPCVLWLTGRAQDHSLRWFLFTSARIALVMGALVVLVLLGAALTVGASVGATALVGLTAVTVALALGLSLIWGVATWGADRWIARARTTGAPDE